MPHVIVASTGTHGDVFPYVALGRTLRSRGHRVTLAANESYRQLAGECGLEFASLVSEQEAHEFLADPDVWHPWKSALLGARWGVRFVQRQYQALDALASGEDTILAASPAVVAARFVQEQRGCPLATIFHTPWIIASSTAPPAMMTGTTLPRRAPRFIGSLYWRAVDLVGWGLVGRHLNQLRSGIGLKPIRRLFQWWTSPDLAIALFPDWFAPAQPDWPAQTRVAGFPMFDGTTTEAVDPEVAEFCHAGDPPVVFTFGTGMMHARELFRASIEACGSLGRRGVILARHREQVPERLSATVRHFEYVPLGPLLSHCAAIVHHGGIGTTARSLARGTPQVIVPHAWDQLDNALRVQTLGAGAIVRRKRFDASRLADAISEVLQEHVSHRCREIAMWFGKEDPMVDAARWIEELAS